MSEQQSEFSESYSDDNFWNKVTTFAQSAGVEVIYRAFQLYYAAHGPNTPVWAKATIYGALGYFISPIDAIPDLVPVVGYSDDLGVLALSVATCAAYITPEIKTQAKQAMKELWDNLFGGESPEECDLP